MNTSKKSSILCLIVLVSMWEAYANVNKDTVAMIPAFSTILKQFILEIAKFEIIKATCISLSFVIKGYVLSVLFSMVVAILGMKSRVINILFNTLYRILSPLPSVAVLPVIMIVGGLNENSIIMLIVHSVFWPSLAAYMAGFGCVPKVYEDFSNNLNLSFIKKYIFIYLPAALPHIITGLRTSWGRAWRSLISAEAIFGISGATQGLGYYIYYYRAFANMKNVFVGIIIISLISFVIEEIFLGIERWTIKKWGMSK